MQKEISQHALNSQITNPKDSLLGFVICILKIAMRLLLTTTLFIFILAACEPCSEVVIQGQWRAIELSEEGDSLALNLDDINFLFKENGRYEFQSTLKYKEAGTFRLDGPFLFSTDTTKNVGVEKAVEIIQLTGDTLILRMQNQEKERTMVLVRVNFS